MRDSLGRVNSRDLTGDFFKQQPLDAVAWVQARNIPLLGDKAVKVLEDLYSEAGWLGWASSKALIAKGRERRKAIEADGGVDWGGWTPGDPDAATNLLSPFGTENLTQLLESRKTTISGIEQTRYQELATILADGVENGLSMDTVAGNISTYLNKDVGWAETVARTETRAAVTAASIDSYKDSQIEQVEWLVAWDEACDICQGYADMGPVGIMEGFDGLEGPPGHPNCFPSGTLVHGPSLEGVVSRWYEGELTHLRFAQGDGLACTPNHPVLTDRGWVPASSLNVGAKVFRQRGFNGGSVGDVYDNQVPALIEDVVESFAGSPGVASREVPVAAPDFHGDGAGSDVAVVWSDVRLDGEGDSFTREHRCDHFLTSAAGDRVGGTTGGTLDQLVLTGGSAFRRVIGVGREAFAFLWRSIRRKDVLAFAAGASRDGVFPKDAVDDVTGNAVEFCEVLDGRAPEICATDLVGWELDSVTAVEASWFAGHVFNLQTDRQWYYANSIVVHNCLCVVIPVVPIPETEEEPPTFDPDAPWLPSEVVLGDKTGEAAGSNRAGVSGFWQGTDGVARYVKEYANPEQAWGEVLSNRLYQLMGAESPVSALSSYVNAAGEVKTLLVTGIVENTGTVGSRGLTSTIAEQISRHFATDLWLANYDAVGTGLDNVVLTSTGVARIDQGGSLLFRAMGAPKVNTLSDLYEVNAEPFFGQNQDYARVLAKAGYKSVSDMDTELASQIRALRVAVDDAGGTRALVDQVIDEITANGGTVRVSAGKYAALLDKRLASLESKYGTPQSTLTQSGIPATSVGETVQRGADIPFKHGKSARDFTATTGPRWGTRSFKTWRDEVTADPGQYQAVQSYTSSGYGWMNPGLRDGLRAGNTVIDSTTQNVIDALARPTAVVKQDVIAMRGVSYMADDRLAEFRALNVGDVLHDYGFQSTSVNSRSAFDGPVILRILVPKGTNAAYLGKISVFENREQELLLQAGTSLRIDAINTVVDSAGNVVKTIADVTVVDQRPGEIVSAAFYAGKMVMIL